MNLESPNIAKGTYQHVLGFLETWLDWAEDFAIGKVDTTLGYSAGFGLCSNSVKYQNKANAQEEHRKIGILVSNALGDIFAMNGMDRHRPFNSKKADYNKECIDHVCHLNPKRIAWVKEAIESIRNHINPTNPESNTMTTTQPTLVDQVKQLVDENQKLTAEVELLKQRQASIDAGLVLAGYQYLDTPNYRKYVHKKEDKAAWIPLYKKA